MVKKMDLSVLFALMLGKLEPPFHLCTLLQWTMSKVRLG